MANNDCNRMSRKFSSIWWRMAVLHQAAMMLGLAFSGVALADNTEKAKTIVTQICSACHGMDGNSKDPIYPKLAGRHRDYVVRELNEFASGKRKSDIMSPIVATVDPGDFNALGEYFAAQKPTSDKVLDQAAAEAGKKLYIDGDEDRGVPACAECHEANGSGSGRYPRLAGQHRQYLIEQLHNFQKGVRDYNTARFMSSIARRLTDDEINELAEFITGL
ncbi:MAG: c-type cytochrome [Burkholderiales bacterium]